jgi:hypothetical protein
MSIPERAITIIRDDAFPMSWQRDANGDWVCDRYRIIDDEEKEAFMVVEDGQFATWVPSLTEAKNWCRNHARHLAYSIETGSPNGE